MFIDFLRTGNWSRVPTPTKAEIESDRRAEIGEFTGGAVFANGNSLFTDADLDYLKEIGVGAKSSDPAQPE